MIISSGKLEVGQMATGLTDLNAQPHLGQRMQVLREATREEFVAEAIQDGIDPKKLIQDLPGIYYYEVSLD